MSKFYSDVRKPVNGRNDDMNYVADIMLMFRGMLKNNK